MIGSAKPLASLSSGLLARKGQARPAMRPQGYAGFGPQTSLEDLGWNDMGSEPVGQPPADAAPRPPVLVQREELEAAVAAPERPLQPEPAADAAPAALAVPAPVGDLTPAAADAVARIGQEARRAGKAAFTLRLAADCHLRLRLASAVQLRSAQAVVSEALDRYLATLPHVDELARRCTHSVTADQPGDPQ